MKYKKPELTRVEVKIKPNTNASDRSSCEGGHCVKATYSQDPWHQTDEEANTNVLLLKNGNSIIEERSNIMLKSLFKLLVHYKYSTKWICPYCGCEFPYRGEGNMKCPLCGKWMEDEQ